MADQQYTSKGRDAETGLDYFNARYISSPQGRFTSPDAETVHGSFGNPQAWNKYAYNSPLHYTDPDGRAPQDSLATAQFERDAHAVLAGQISKEEFQARNAARATGTATGAGISFGPEIGAYARGLWYALTSYFMTPKGQETAASMLEGLSAAPPGSLTGQPCQAIGRRDQHGRALRGAGRSSASGRIACRRGVC